MIRWSAALLMVLGVTACGADGGAADEVDGPLLVHPGAPAEGEQEGMAAEIRGVLVLEGDCLYVSLDEVGERYPVLWPAGTTWDDGAVVTAAGERLEIGAEVYGGGGYLDVAALAQLAGEDAAEVARGCVDDPDGEIAIVNNHPDAIGSPR